MDRSTSLLLILVVIISISSLAHADMINPGYYTTHCNAGEVEVECEYSTCFYNPYIWRDQWGYCQDGCIALRTNPAFRQLITEGHSLGGKEKWCGPYSPNLGTTYNGIPTFLYYISLNSILNFAFLVNLILTILLELIAGSVYSYIRKWNFRKIAPVIVVANLISYPLLNFLFQLLLEVPFFTTLVVNLNVYSFFATFEVLAIAIELLVYRFLAKLSYKDAALLSIVVNIFSSVVGLFILHSYPFL